MRRTMDPRYQIIKPMLNEGKITTFQDIFLFIKKSVVAKDIGKRNSRFTELINNVDDFTVKELKIIARLCDLTIDEMFKLISAELAKKEIKS